MIPCPYFDAYCHIVFTYFDTHCHIMFTYFDTYCHIMFTYFDTYCHTMFTYFDTYCHIMFTYFDTYCHIVFTYYDTMFSYYGLGFFFPIFFPFLRHAGIIFSAPTKPEARWSAGSGLEWGLILTIVACLDRVRTVGRAALEDWVFPA